MDAKKQTCCCLVLYTVQNSYCTSKSSLYSQKHILTRDALLITFTLPHILKLSIINIKRIHPSNKNYGIRIFLSSFLPFLGGCGAAYSPLAFKPGFVNSCWASRQHTWALSFETDLEGQSETVVQHAKAIHREQALHHPTVIFCYIFCQNWV